VVSQRKRRSPEEFDAPSAELVQAALLALEVATHGRVIIVIGCDYEGTVWLLPSPKAPLDVIKEALKINFAKIYPQLGEHIVE
jgi:hypothetical protein